MAPHPELAGQTPCEAAASFTRKVWQTDVLPSSAGGSEQGEMALRAFEKAPVIVISHDVFPDFLRVFPHAFPSGRKWARIR
jgi:hypothetical protein